MGDPTTDAILLLIRRHAHTEAIAETVATMGQELGQFCMGMLGDQAEAEEVLVELLVRFHDAMPTLGDAALRSYLYGTAWDLCRRRMSESATRAADDDTARGSDETSRARLARAGLARLEPTERVLLLLRYMARLGYAQAAGVVEVDEAEARKRVGRGLLALRQARRSEHPPACEEGT